jgi:HEAT repeat protein
VPALCDVLKDPEWSVRYHAALSLGDIGDTDAVIPLIKALNDAREDVRRGIVESLGRLGDKRAVAALERQRKSESKNDERLVAAVIDTVLPGLRKGRKVEPRPRIACCRSPLSTRRRSSPRQRFWRRALRQPTLWRVRSATVRKFSLRPACCVSHESGTPRRRRFALCEYSLCRLRNRARMPPYTPEKPSR